MEKGEAVKKPLLENYNGQGSEISSSAPLTIVVGFSCIVVYCSSFAGGNSIGYSSPAESGILNDLGLDLADYSVFVSIFLIGSLCGAVWSGKVAEFIGRRGTMGVTDLFCITGWLAIAFSKDALWLDFGRFLVGCGVGLSCYAAPIYVAEITPKTVRGALMSVKPLLMSSGKALFFFIGPVVNWRILALTALVPYLLQLPGLLFISESPRWLMKIGQAEKSESALRRLRGEKANISQETAEIRDYIEYSKRVSGDGILSVFQRKYSYCLIVGTGLVAFRQLGGLGGISFYASSIIKSAGFSSEIGSIAVGTTEILSAILGVCFIDKFGRRPLLLISAAGTCFGSFILGLSFFLQGLHFGEKITPVLGLAGILVYFGFFSLGMEGIPWIISKEIFPVNIKGAAGSIASVVSLISGWVISYTFNFIFEWNSAGTFFIYAAMSGASVLFVWKMVPETKGRSLEEIQASLLISPQQ
ncbi:sugar transporter ERD6-like 5 [Morus notabilis]|uniref:sugar transporter ERD6-like 5 n=1 Tax=Morus notabilis TaxID=981085 RepID=UPI000CED5A41|nr:sugar transporter ERD6-like 5 [Morus notabilis]